MWEKEYLVNAWVDVLIISKHKAIVLWPKGSIKNKFYIAHIFPKNNCSTITLECEDYDLLKLKAIIKAKEIGWDVFF